VYLHVRKKKIESNSNEELSANNLSIELIDKEMETLEIKNGNSDYENPYAFVGVAHNDALSDFMNSSLNLQTQMNEKVDFFAENVRGKINNLKGYEPNLLPNDRMVELSNFDKDNIENEFDQVNNGNVKLNVYKNMIHNILSLSENVGFSFTINRFRVLEKIVSKDQVLDEKEKSYILSALAVAIKSSTFWKDSDIDDIIYGKKGWWKVALADTGGFFVGAFGADAWNNYLNGNIDPIGSGGAVAAIFSNEARGE
jgi:hypothetical protein